MGQLTNIFKNRRAIWEGIRNKTFKQEHIEDVYRDRREICEGCPDIDKEGSKCVVPITHPCCGLCGCSLGLKLRVLSEKCPADKWLAIVTKQESDMIDEIVSLNKSEDDTQN